MKRTLFLKKILPLVLSALTFTYSQGSVYLNIENNSNYGPLSDPISYTQSSNQAIGVQITKSKLENITASINVTSTRNNAFGIWVDGLTPTTSTLGTFSGTMDISGLSQFSYGYVTGITVDATSNSVGLYNASTQNSQGFLVDWSQAAFNVNNLNNRNAYALYLSGSSITDTIGSKLTASTGKAWSYGIYLTHSSLSAISNQSSITSDSQSFAYGIFLSNNSKINSVNATINGSSSTAWVMGIAVESGSSIDSLGADTQIDVKSLGTANSYGIEVMDAQSTIASISGTISSTSTSGEALGLTIESEALIGTIMNNAEFTVTGNENSYGIMMNRSSQLSSMGGKLTVTSNQKTAYGALVILGAVLDDVTPTSNIISLGQVDANALYIAGSNAKINSVGGVLTARAEQGNAYGIDVYSEASLGIVDETTVITSVANAGGSAYGIYLGEGCAMEGIQGTARIQSHSQSGTAYAFYAESGTDVYISGGGTSLSAYTPSGSAYAIYSNRNIILEALEQNGITEDKTILRTQGNIEITDTATLVFKINGIANQNTNAYLLKDSQSSLSVNNIHVVFNDALYEENPIAYQINLIDYAGTIEDYTQMVKFYNYDGTRIAGNYWSAVIPEENLYSIERRPDAVIINYTNEKEFAQDSNIRIDTQLIVGPLENPYAGMATAYFDQPTTTLSVKGNIDLQTEGSSLVFAQNAKVSANQLLGSASSLSSTLGNIYFNSYNGTKELSALTLVGTYQVNSSFDNYAQMSLTSNSYYTHTSQDADISFIYNTLTGFVDYTITRNSFLENNVAQPGNKAEMQLARLLDGLKTQDNGGVLDDYSASLKKLFISNTELLTGNIAATYVGDLAREELYSLQAVQWNQYYRSASFVQLSPSLNPTYTFSSINRFGNYGHDQALGLSGLNYQSTGGVAQTEYTLPSLTQLGLGIGGSYSKVSGNGISAEGNTFLLNGSIYQSFSENWQAFVQMGYLHSQNDKNGLGKASWTNQGMSIFSGISRNIELANHVTLRPMAGIMYAWIHSGDFTDSIYLNHVESRTYHSLKPVIGTELWMPISDKWSSTARAFYTCETLDKQYNTVVSLPGSTPLLFQGRTESRSLVQASVGLQYKLTENVLLYADYTALLQRRNWGNALNGGITFAF